MVRTGLVKIFFKIFSKLSDQQKKDLRRMRDDNLRSNFHYQPGPGRGWRKIVKEFEYFFDREGINDVQNQFYNSRFAAAPPESKVYYFFACNFYFNLLKKRDKFNIIEKLKKTQTSISPNVECIIDGLIVTWDLVNALHQILSIAEIDKSLLYHKKTFLDLGAGWGRVGHLLSRINPKIIYIAADLPESLLISQTYLPETLSKKINFFKYTDNCKNLDFKKSGIYFIGSHHLGNIKDKKIDFLINIASFQEMKNAQVKLYLEDFDRIVDGIFYTKQINRSNPKDGFMKTNNQLYFYPKNWKKKFLRYPEVWPGYFEAAYKI